MKRSFIVLLDDNIFGQNNRFSSYTCAINDGDEVVLTGGFENGRAVAVYSSNGFQSYLPDLNVARQDHACSSYHDDNDEKVK